MHIKNMPPIFDFDTEQKHILEGLKMQDTILRCIDTCYLIVTKSEVKSEHRRKHLHMITKVMVTIIQSSIMS